MRARNTVPRWISAAAVLLALAPGVFAKPLLLVVERELDDAVLIAEVSVLRVEIADWLGEGGRRGGVVVQVTADPERIYRGPRFLGRQLRLHAAPAGPQSCTAELNTVRGSAAKVLLVVDADLVIRLAGTEVEDQDAYRLRGWCDYNACLLRSETPGLGTPVAAETRLGGTSRFDIDREALGARFRGECAAFWGLTARFLAGETPAAEPAEIARYLEAVETGDAGRREAAQERLVARGVLHVARIREAARQAADPEARRCLGHVLARLQLPADAYDAAVRLAGAPVEARIHVVRSGLADLDGEAAARVRDHRDRLEAEAAGATPPPPATR